MFNPWLISIMNVSRWKCIVDWGDGNCPQVRKWACDLQPCPKETQTTTARDPILTVGVRSLSASLCHPWQNAGTSLYLLLCEVYVVCLACMWTIYSISIQFNLQEGTGKGIGHPSSHGPHWIRPWSVPTWLGRGDITMTHAMNSVQIVKHKHNKNTIFNLVSSDIIIRYTVHRDREK